MTAASKLATYADLLATPRDVKAEILAGELVTQPSALPEHSEAQFGLGELLRGPFHRGRGGPGGWWILGEVDVQFTDHDVVRPDLVGWRRERLPSPWGKRPIDVVPDWICEVLSPKGVRRDRVVKLELYARHGVPFYWLIDPVAAVLEAFTHERGRWVLAGTYDRSAVARVPPFEAIELVVADLFMPEPPESAEE
ncbi:Uma2 family endonuclease [Nannocystis sp. ILAH1]|uniref:Uma2 family endonuclease n=1 Tax=Nannocystis sp. ILAH1 TaxID=2996789 RepID=UPI00226D8908|nr:Uma2 family endonuclease [Nannocystis sp. ILAH1]MCY0995073.1 Uma2 family endonuclease [Nannocystis sp. ILAH1]